MYVKVFILGMLFALYAVKYIAKDNIIIGFKTLFLYMASLILGMILG